MLNKLYVCNIPYSMTSEDLLSLFSTCGNVVYANAVREPESKKPTGYGFVEMETEEGKLDAIRLLNGRVIKRRLLQVSDAIDTSTRIVRPRAVVQGKGTCILCGIENDLTGYPNTDKGICGACAKIMNSVHYHHQQSNGYTRPIEKEAIIECTIK